MSMFNPHGLAQILALAALANGMPVFAKKALGPVGAWPLDGNRRGPDGRPWFGPSKTWRGIVAALAATTAAAPLLGLDWTVGAKAGALAMAGDLLSSFAKRRLGLPPSSRATGLDQIPEALLPLLGCAGDAALGVADIALGTALFLFGEIGASRLLYRLHLRDRPY